MKRWTQLAAAFAAPVLLWGGAAFGQTTPMPGTKVNTPKTVEGQVVRIDRKLERVTIRATDGTMHEFQASAATLQDLKEGDSIQARLRQ